MYKRQVLYVGNQVIPRLALHRVGYSSAGGRVADPVQRKPGDDLIANIQNLSLIHISHRSFVHLSGVYRHLSSPFAAYIAPVKSDQFV